MLHSKLVIKFMLLFTLISSICTPVFSDETLKNNLPVVYIIPVKGTIDLGLSAFITRSIEQAQTEKARAIVLEIDTFGGRVDAANEIVSSMQKISAIPTFAYITNSAWSAGALIALSCNKIIMQKGASIGSAEPRIMGITPGAESVDEKTTSALRAKFKATAEVSKHNSALAMAMVDKDVELIQIKLKDKFLILTRGELKAKEKELNLNAKTINSENIISEKEKLLNLTAQEALNLNLAVSIVDSEKDFLDYLKNILTPPPNTTNTPLADFKIVRPAPTWSENIVRFLTHPIVSSLLLSLGFLGIIFELKMPGWGISGTMGLAFIILFFWGHYLVGLASWLDILVISIGIILLGAEFFIIPGFGIAGILGIALIIGGLILSLIKYPLTFPALELGSALNTIGFSLIIFVVFLFMIFRFFPQSNLWQHILLRRQETKKDGFEVKSLPKGISVDRIGITKSILRPSGRAEFDDLSVDVTTQGEFIPKGEKIKVVQIQGNKVIVEKIKGA